MVWLGDLNVAADARDATDESFFRDYWTSKRHASKKDYIAATPLRDRGIPGFSDNERRRFQDALRAAQLVDAWRWLRDLELLRWHQTHLANANAAASTASSSSSSSLSSLSSSASSANDAALLKELVEAEIEVAEDLGIVGGSNNNHNNDDDPTAKQQQ